MVLATSTSSQPGRSSSAVHCWRPCTNSPEYSKRAASGSAATTVNHAASTPLGERHFRYDSSRLAHETPHSTQRGGSASVSRRHRVRDAAERQRPARRPWRRGGRRSAQREVAARRNPQGGAPAEFERCRRTGRTGPTVEDRPGEERSLHSLHVHAEENG